jgi:hypothetical protein
MMEYVRRRWPQSYLSHFWTHLDKSLHNSGRSVWSVSRGIITLQTAEKVHQETVNSILRFFKYFFDVAYLTYVFAHEVPESLNK